MALNKEIFYPTKIQVTQKCWFVGRDHVRKNVSLRTEDQMRKERFWNTWVSSKGMKVKKKIALDGYGSDHVR